MLNLRWHDVGDTAIKLLDSETGPLAVPFGEAARAHISALLGERRASAFLFPRSAEGQGQYSPTTCWRTGYAYARLEVLCRYDLPHTAISQIVMSGENLPLVGMLLGPRLRRTTAGYVHPADGHLVAAEKVGALITEAMIYDTAAREPMRQCRQQTLRLVLSGRIWNYVRCDPPVEPE